MNSFEEIILIKEYSEKLNFKNANLSIDVIYNTYFMQTLLLQIFSSLQNNYFTEIRDNNVEEDILSKMSQNNLFAWIFWREGKLSREFG